ncbi:cell division protein ZapA [Acidovorax sp. HDW3]|uniref:cell division protein ZapA n=1 Tax=Acidovorax sp. HDW3 TaxID=2714923 RepID=UPI001407703A|nr:cell division protein ZapA [Acidovorax sp. HDW3]QIL43641.1 cell division protein ZapA [Acidovorax sp. HDW3]
MKQLEVHIMQQSYLLSCPEGQESRLLEAVERVDTAMTRIRDAGKVRARERIAVLAALNLAFEVVDRAQQPPAAAATPTPATMEDTDIQGDDLAFARALALRLDEALGSSGQLF